MWFNHDLHVVFIYTALVMFIVLSFYQLSVQPFCPPTFCEAWSVHSVIVYLHVNVPGTWLSLFCTASLFIRLMASFAILSCLL